MNWRDAVFRIDGVDNRKPVCGSGFACARDCNKTYLLRSSPVIRAVREDNHWVLNKPITVFNLPMFYQKFTAYFMPHQNAAVSPNTRFR